jgi:nicotinamide riboside kinase
MEMKKKWRIAITGPESSGKTDLAIWLTKRFEGAQLVKEYAREFLEKRLPETEYTLDDVLTIGTEQHRQIKEVDGDIVFFDTDYLVLHIWLKEMFGVHDSVFFQRFQQESFDLYLLCAPDLEWTFDPLRVNEYDRNRLFALYESCLKRAGKQYAIISGSGDARGHMALEAVTRLLNSPSFF